MNDRDRNSEIREPVAAYAYEPVAPESAFVLDGFRDWARSEDFPETGRIDFLAGEMEVEMSPEDLQTHGTVKTAIVAELFSHIARRDRGFVFADRARVSAPASQLSVEPDVVAVLFESFERGTVRQIPASSKGAGRFVELEGAPDLVVEILSDSSVHKDTQLLPPRYAAAGIPELWLVDARREDIRFDVKVLEAGEYRSVEPDAAGYTSSPILSGKVRLHRRPTPHSGWLYELDVKAVVTD